MPACAAGERGRRSSPTTSRARWASRPGASAPDELVEAVVARLAPRHGVEEVHVTDEDEYFPPPPELRDLLRGLAAALAVGLAAPARARSPRRRERGDPDVGAGGRRSPDLRRRRAGASGGVSTESPGRARAGLVLSSAPGRWVLAAAVLGSAITAIDSTVVGIALPAIGRNFALPVSSLQWVVTAYLVSLAGLLLVGGALGDRYGRRRVFVVGVVVVRGVVPGVRRSPPTPACSSRGGPCRVWAGPCSPRDRSPSCRLRSPPTTAPAPSGRGRVSVGSPPPSGPSRAASSSARCRGA